MRMSKNHAFPVSHHGVSVIANCSDVFLDTSFVGTDMHKCSHKSLELQTEMGGHSDSGLRKVLIKA